MEPSKDGPSFKLRRALRRSRQCLVPQTDKSMTMIHDTSKRVLLAVADSATRQRWADRLRLSGFHVEVAASPEQAVDKAVTFLPEIVVVADEPTDSRNPLEVTWRIRSAVPPASLPVFMMAVDNGADSHPDQQPASRPDASAVPTSLLIDRIARFFDSSSAAELEDQLEFDGLRLDRARHRTWVDEQYVKLTPTEFRLLWELASRPGYVLSRDELTRACKGSDTAVQSRTIDAHVKSIRRKLHSHAQMIETVHGVGYRFQEAEAMDRSVR